MQREQCYGCGREAGTDDPFVDSLGCRVHRGCMDLARRVYDMREWAHHAAVDAQVRAVPCPHCLAEGGGACITPSGKPADLHRARRQLYRMVVNGLDLERTFRNAMSLRRREE